MPANVNLDPSIAMGLKQSDPMTSLGNMLNVANAMQQYKQAQQVNPLLLQQRQMEIEQAQQLNPLAVQQKQMELEQAQKVNPLIAGRYGEELEQSKIGTQEAQQKLRERRLKNIADSQISLINNPLIVKAEKEPGAVSTADLTKLILRNGSDQAKALGIPVEQANELIKPYLEIAQNTPGGLRQFLKERHLAGLDQASLGAAIQPTGVAVGTGAGGRVVSTNEFAAVPPGGTVPGTAYVTQLAPGSREAIEQDATGNKVVVVRDANGQIISSKPVPGGAQRPAAAVSPNMPAMPYPIRIPGEGNFNVSPDEKAQQEAGTKYTINLQNNANNLTTAKRNLEEVIKEATGLQESAIPTSGIVGAAIRNLRNWAGDPTYKKLSKDLANLQISQIAAAGGSMDTVAGQALTKYANGDETYPPEVLISIAKRTYADVRNTEMQAEAASKFAAKNGPANISVFKNLWSKNADSRIFELMNLEEAAQGLTGEELNKAKKEMELLIGPKKSEKAKKLYKKYKNIKTLTENGEL